MPGLDHAFYPHLIDNILSYSESWLPMRTTNREFRDRIDRFYEHLIIAPTSWDYLDKDEPEQEVGPFLFFTPRAWISGIGPRVFGPDEPHSAREREQRVLIQRLLRLARIVDVRGYVDEYSWITDAVNDPGARVELVRLFSLPYRWESTNLLAIKAPRVIFVPVDVDPDGEPFALQAWDNYMAATDGVKQTTQNVAFNKHGEWLMLPTRQDENGDPTAVDLCRMVWMFPDWPLESVRATWTLDLGKGRL